MIEKPPVVSSDARKYRRARTLLAGVCCYRDDSGSLDCTIRDLSGVGARLRFASSSTLPSRFYLINLKEGVAYGAEVAWIKGKDVGVSWKEKISLLESGHRFGHLRRLWWAKR